MSRESGALIGYQRAGKMALSSPLGITRCVPRSYVLHVFIIPFIKSFIYQACSIILVSFFVVVCLDVVPL